MKSIFVVVVKIVSTLGKYTEISNTWKMYIVWWQVFKSKVFRKGWMFLKCRWKECIEHYEKVTFQWRSENLVKLDSDMIGTKVKWQVLKWSDCNEWRRVCVEIIGFIWLKKKPHRDRETMPSFLSLPSLILQVLSQRLNSHILYYKAELVVLKPCPISFSNTPDPSAVFISSLLGNPPNLTSMSSELPCV